MKRFLFARRFSSSRSSTSQRKSIRKILILVTFRLLPVDIDPTLFHCLVPAWILTSEPNVATNIASLV